MRRVRCVARAALLVPILLLLLGGPARHLAAQPARGVVRDSASQQPVSGAVVLFLDSLGRTVARSTTDQRGQYYLATPAGARRLRILRLGFRPRETDLPAPGGAGAPADVAIVPIPILLDQVRVTAAATCSRRADRVAALALLDHVRAGLLATVVAGLENAPRMTRLLYKRRFDGASDRVLSQTVRVSAESMADRSFRAARSASAFVEHGFRADSAGGQYFFSPDAETLLDEDFASGYCFHLAPADRSRPRELGLAFEPANRKPGRIDIAGALWVDTVARTLRTLEFRYLGLDPAIGALAPGGRLSFREMANGVVVIDRWSMRLVSGHLEVDTRIGSTGQISRTQTSHLYAEESGGELARAAWRDGVRWRAPLGTLRIDAVAHEGGTAAGTIVRLADTDYQATADSSGALEITDLLPGSYTASVLDPRLAALGIRRVTPLPVVARRDSTVHVRLQVETADDYMVKRCAADRPSAGSVAILGRVIASDGESVRDSRWTLRGQDGSVLVDRGRVGADGLFHWCQVVRGTMVAIEIEQGTRRTRATQLSTNPLTIIQLDLARP
jgi:hypothetical protein